MDGDEQDTDDRILIQRFLAGEEATFDLLVARYYQRIDRLVQHVVGHPMMAEDIAQETFLRAYRALPRFRGEASFYSWLYRIAINLCMSYLRQRPPAARLSEEVHDATPAFAADPSSLLECDERHRLVRQAIAALPAHYRIVVILRDLEGFSYQEIAALLSIPLGTVKSRLNFGKRLLRDSLRPLLNDGA
jgi:RNA polymerase sigma-70 factor (ECF subfamily)